LCYTAVKQNGYAIAAVPYEFITSELCFLAIECKSGDSILENIPNGFCTQELCLAVVKNCGYQLRYVPFDELTLEVCIAAVLNNDYALKFVPKFHLKKVQAALEKHNRKREKKFAKDYAKGFKEGIKKGKLKGHLEVARNMLAEGYSPDKIARITGISKRTLKSKLAAQHPA